MGFCSEISMLNGYAIVNLDNCKESHCVGNSASYTFKQTTLNDNPVEIDLLEYTGLKDADGKEIYEGDIIELFGDKYTVVMEEGEWMLHSEFRQADRLTDNTDVVKLLGNIHPNPELMEPY